MKLPENAQAPARSGDLKSDRSHLNQRERVSPADDLTVRVACALAQTSRSRATRDRDARTTSLKNRLVFQGRLASPL
ncbi:MAG: hypothetical protein KME17_13505 [Cyanosarcina radialis HA8281-LM2]|nr:hypothetical protein [Cyanosarcina radialis HA8281-LM2]